MFFFKNKFFIIFLIIISLDFVFSKVIFKKTDLWNSDLYKGKPWRIQSKFYHHDLSPYISEVEMWGENKQRLITNSLGFRDSSKKTILKVNKKNRILLIGDSFIEGLGYDYKFTLSGLLQNFYGSEYEILNSAVASYSPGIYYFKTKFLIDKGYKFDKALVFLDISDVIDEMYLKFNLDGTLNISNNEKKTITLKNKIYKFGYILRDNFVIFRFFSVLSDQTEILKNNFKDRYQASKFFNKSFLKISNKELNLFKMLNVDRGTWTNNQQLYNEAKLGVQSSEIFLDKLFKLLNTNKIESYLIIYPWPAQIFNGDNFHQNYWKNFSDKRNLNFLSLYPYFEGKNKSEIIFKNFIPGDVHWNKEGTSIIFEAIKEKGILNN